MANLKETLEERGKEYGSFEKLANLSQTLKGLLVTGNMSDVQTEAMEMICSKLSRIVTGNADNEDSWRDIAGYAMLVALDLDGDG